MASGTLHAVMRLGGRGVMIACLSRFSMCDASFALAIFAAASVIRRHMSQPRGVLDSPGGTFKEARSPRPREQKDVDESRPVRMDEAFTHRRDIVQVAEFEVDVSVEEKQYIEELTSMSQLMMARSRALAAKNDA